MRGHCGTTQIEYSLGARSVEQQAHGLRIAIAAGDDQCRIPKFVLRICVSACRNQRSDDASALCFHIEAANGKAVEVIVPYARRSSDVIAFDDPQISPVQPEIFTETM